ncbi:MAG: hypothetical protein AAGB46_19330 [Verrucomicrobiota bacterium]
MWLQMKLARYQVAIFTLVLLLQRAPMIRHLVQFEKAISAPMAQMIRWATVGATALGGMHTYSGASTLVSNIDLPAVGQVDENFSLVLEVRDTASMPRSWTVEGNLPPGLAITGLSNGSVNTVFLTIAGVPTQAGQFSFKVQPWRGLGGTGLTTDSGAFDINIEVLGPPVDVVEPELTTSRVDDGILVEWEGVEGLTYSIERSPNLEDFVEDGRSISIEGSKRSFVILLSEVQSFRSFQVKAEN